MTFVDTMLMGKKLFGRFLIVLVFLGITLIGYIALEGMKNIGLFKNGGERNEVC